jgi:hypothetical protein
LLVTGALKKYSQLIILQELGWQPLADRVKLLRVSLLFKGLEGTS